MIKKSDYPQRWPMFPDLLSFPEIPKVTSDTDSHCRYQNLHIRLTIQKQKHKKKERENMYEDISKSTLTTAIKLIMSRYLLQSYNASESKMFR